RKNIGEGGRDDHAKSEITQRPRRVLARRTAPEIAARHQDRGVSVRRPVQNKVGTGLAVGRAAPIVKKKFAVAGTLDALQKLLGDDLIGVHVGTIERRHDSGMNAERFHIQSQPRTSVKCPLMAAAAAMAGLTRWVRPPRPWRPSKLRLLVDAQRSPGPRTS